LEILIDVVRSHPGIRCFQSQANCNIIQGTGDNFYKQKQLLPENFIEAAKKAGVDAGIKLRMQPDYDHSYFFISTFANDHVEWAAERLLK
jgi:S-formylglutathione hydrolase FrmB